MTAGPNPGKAWPVLTSPAVSRKRWTYCDTGIIVAIEMEVVEPFLGGAVHFLEAAKSRGMRLVISNLALAEAVDVMRKGIKEGRSAPTKAQGMRGIRGEAAAAGQLQAPSVILSPALAVACRRPRR